MKRRFFAAALVFSSASAFSMADLSGQWVGACAIDDRTVDSRLVLNAEEHVLRIGEAHGLLPMMQMPVGKGTKLKNTWIGSNGRQHEQSYAAQWVGKTLQIDQRSMNYLAATFKLRTDDDGKLLVKIKGMGLERNCTYTREGT